MSGSRPPIASVALVSFLVVLSTIGVLWIIVYENRAVIFDYFAAGYIEKLREGIAVTEGEPDKKEPTSPSSFLTEETLITGIVRRVNPAVVSIAITKDVPIIERYYERFDPFPDFFGEEFPGPFGFEVPRVREKGRERREVGGGSGFFVSPNGLIITNRHVVADPDATYTAFTNTGEKYDAKVLAKDPLLDIAVLKVFGGPFAYLQFGNSDILELGQTVIAIGNALGEFRNSVSVGVISGLSRSIVAGDFSGRTEFLDEVIQTDAAISPGNSGGPLLNLEGLVVGMNVAVARAGENIGFALPANTVKAVVDSVAEHGEIVRPFLGIRYVQITPTLKEKNQLAVDYGVLVVRGPAPEELAVIPGSAADKAGILENDLILEFDGVKLDGKRSLASLIRRKSVSDTVTLKVLSKGKEKIITVTLERFSGN